MHKTLKRILTGFGLCVVALGILFLARDAVHAQTVSIDFPSSFAGFSSQDLKTTIQNIVRIVLGFIGILFMLLVFYGGFVWMTSRGEEQKISQAKKIIISAVMGLLVTLSSYAIASFIINSWSGTGNVGGGGGPGGGPGGFPGGFALGAGVLESHYPGRNATGIPRNTNIFVTFKEAINLGTMCAPGPDGTLGTADDTVLVSSVEITDVSSVVPTGDLNNAGPDNILEGVDCATTDATNTTFKFDPRANLGLSNGDVLYQVYLKSGIMTAAGKGALPLGYSWRFTVNNVVDNIPPKVLSVIPVASSIASRNSLVQITFSEPVDPSTASGINPPYANITLDSGGFIPGSYISGNQYTVTEFVSNVLCGVNSCGQNIYCLPATATIAGTVNTSIMDMAGNNLDQDQVSTNGNQSFIWSFQTDNNIDLNQPVMNLRVPIKTPKQSNVDLFLPVEMQFSKLLSASSITSQNVGLGRDPSYVFGSGIGSITNEGNFWVGKQDVDTNGDGVADQSKVFIYHDAFTPLRDYNPGANSNIKDINQNCYFRALCVGASC